MTQSDLQNWVGRQVVLEAGLPQQPARFMEATLDRAPGLNSGDALPPLWHWLYFLEAKPLSELGRDGHAQRGEFLPPVHLPRRMWAGGRCTFQAPLRLGQMATKTSTIKSVVEKLGRSGALCFVTVEHELRQNGAVAVTEEHDIVYREDPHPDAPRPEPVRAPQDAAFCETITPSEVMLFRYSALTFNGHRIHYDMEYAKRVEGYNGLVVHGPLIATLLVDLACRRRGRSPTAFAFRALAPIDTLNAFSLEGREQEDTIELWAKRADGALAMSATAHF